MKPLCFQYFTKKAPHTLSRLQLFNPHFHLRTHRYQRDPRLTLNERWGLLTQDKVVPKAALTHSHWPERLQLYQSPDKQAAVGRLGPACVLICVSCLIFIPCYASVRRAFTDRRSRVRYGDAELTSGDMVKTPQQPVEVREQRAQRM